MPAMKKEVFASVKRKLEAEQQQLRDRLNSNRYKMRTLVAEQTNLKREVAAMGALLKSMTVK